MVKCIKYFLTFIGALCSLVLGALLFLQSEWAKDKIGLILEEIALQQGFKLKIEKIEGELPLKWTLSHIRLDLSDTDSVDIDRMRLRLSLFPLLRGNLSISYLSADKTVYRFDPQLKNSPSPVFTTPFSIRLLKLKEFTAINLATNDTASYSLAGGCRFRKKGSFFDLHAKVHSSDLDLALYAQGENEINLLAADIDLNVKSDRAFAPFITFPVATAFRLKTNCKGPRQTWEQLLSQNSPAPGMPIDGELKLDVHHLSIPQLRGLDENLAVTTRFSLFSDRSFHVSSLVLKCDLLCFKGNAEFDPNFFPKTLECSFLLPHLSRVAPYFEGIVKGDIHYTGENCRLEMTSERLDAHLASFNDAQLKLQAHLEQDAWKGDFEFTLPHAELGFQASSSFQLLSDLLELQNLSLQGPKTSLVGDLSLDPCSLTNLKGGLSFQIGDLSLYSQLVPLALAGQLGGTLDFQRTDLRCLAVAKNLKAGEFLSRNVTLDLFATDIFHQMKGKFDLETQQAYVAEAFLHSAKYSMEWNIVDWNYSLQAQGEWKNPFSIASHGSLAFSPGSFQFRCDALSGLLLQKNVEIEKPFTLAIQGQEISLSDFQMQIAGGFLQSSLQLNPQNSKIILQGYHFPLDFLSLLSPRLSLTGFSSIDIDLQGPNNALLGHLNLLLERADIFPAGSIIPIQTKASLQANINQDIVQLHAHIAATGQQVAQVSATIPISYQLYPFAFRIDPEKHIAGQCTIEGHIEQLFDFINIGPHRLGGFLSCRLVSSGTVEKPTLFGPISIQDGFYQNYLIGTSLKNTTVQAIANGSTIAVEQAQIQDTGEGTAALSGLFQLDPQFSFSLQGDLHRFRMIRLDWLGAACSGPFTIKGNLEESRARGTLAIDEAELRIPDQLPTDIPQLPITFINQPASYSPQTNSSSYPFYYDLQVHADHNVRLSGRGLDAELAGDLHIDGKNLAVIMTGSLQTTKGKFFIAGKDFQITHGEIAFSEAGSFINITGNLDLPALAVTVQYRGPLKAPELTFQSSPSLPTSSIISHILFNKNVSELNAFQLPQVADTILTLSGGPAPGVLDAIRKTLGIDNIAISTSATTGQLSLQLGTRVTDWAFFTYIQSTEGLQLIGEMDLKKGFVIQVEKEVNNQGKFSFKWGKNY